MFNKITLKLNNNKHISQFYARSILVNKRREVFKMLPVLPFLLGGALGTVVGFSLKKYFDENQSDIFERIENDTKNLIDRMDFSKLDALKQSVYNGTFISFAQYFNSLNQNELEKFDIKNVEEFFTIGVSTPILVYEDNKNQIKIDKIIDFLDELNSNLISIFYVLQKDTDIDFKNFSQERQALIKEAYNIAKQIENICLSDMVN